MAGFFDFNLEYLAVPFNVHLMTPPSEQAGEEEKAKTSTRWDMAMYRAAFEGTKFTVVGDYLRHSWAPHRLTAIHAGLTRLPNTPPPLPQK